MRQEPLDHTLFTNQNQHLRSPERHSCRKRSSSAPKRTKGSTTVTITGHDVDDDGASPPPPSPLRPLPHDGETADNIDGKDKKLRARPPRDEGPPDNEPFDSFSSDYGHSLLA
eukprot:2295331-Heterocapsa_arctica.AAC.1